jgi:hypothetical protein
LKLHENVVLVVHSVMCIDSLMRILSSDEFGPFHSSTYGRIPGLIDKVLPPANASFRIFFGTPGKFYFVGLMNYELVFLCCRIGAMFEYL